MKKPKRSQSKNRGVKLPKWITPQPLTRKDKIIDGASSVVGVGPLIVGTPTSPGDLEVHVEYTTDQANRRSAIGVKVRASKLALIVLVIGSVMTYAFITNDRELIVEGFQILRSVASTGTHDPVR
jgi:hypothetical protein